MLTKPNLPFKIKEKQPGVLLMKKETLDSLREVGNPSIKVAVAMTNESHKRLTEHLLSKPKPPAPISSLGSPIKTKPRP